MKKSVIKALCLTLAVITVVMSFCSCGVHGNTEDAVASADSVLINGEAVDTVEARAGAFSGKQGDYIEFKFPEQKKINTVFISEKTTSVKQFNIFAEIGGKYTLVYTGKEIVAENITFDTVNATAIKLTVVNTAIGSDEFIIQGVSAYYIEEGGAA